MSDSDSEKFSDFVDNNDGRKYMTKMRAYTSGIRHVSTNEYDMKDGKPPIVGPSHNKDKK